MKRACVNCGRPSDAGSLCGRCGGGTPRRPTTLQDRFRRGLIERSGGRCEDCGARSSDLRACHLRPLAAGGSFDLSNGRLRCPRCDRSTDPYAHG